VKEGEMGRACSTHGGKRNACRVFWESQKERDNYEDLDVGGRIMLKWILEGWGGVDWIDLAQDRPVECFCEHGNKHSESIKYWEILEQLVASQGRFSFMQLSSYLT
jgi:hypothetical protein